MTSDSMWCESRWAAQHGNKLFVKRLPPGAILPTRSHNSAGYDLYAAESITLPPGKVTGVHLGIATQFPAGYVGHVWDRSGMGKKGLKIMGGVIDSDFRGEWIAMLLNTTDTPHEVQRGDRVAQVIFQEVCDPEVVEVETLSETSRGDGAFGSTGR